MQLFGVEGASLDQAVVLEPKTKLKRWYLSAIINFHMSWIWNRNGDPLVAYH